MHSAFDLILNLKYDTCYCLQETIDGQTLLLWAKISTFYSVSVFLRFQIILGCVLLPFQLYTSFFFSFDGNKIYPYKKKKEEKNGNKNQYRIRKHKKCTFISTKNIIIIIIMIWNKYPYKMCTKWLKWLLRNDEMRINESIWALGDWG